MDKIVISSRFYEKVNIEYSIYFKKYLALATFMSTEKSN